MNSFKALLVVAGVGCLLLLFLYNPATAAFYPPCIFKKVTGYNCAGCGAARALHSLLHGRFAAALDYNLLLVLFLPFMVAGLYAYFTGKPNKLWAFANRPLYVLAIISCFWLLRNAEWKPIAWLNADKQLFTVTSPKENIPYYT